MGQGVHRIFSPPTSAGFAAGLRVYASKSEILAETVFYKPLAKQVIFLLSQKRSSITIS